MSKTLFDPAPSPTVPVAGTQDSINVHRVFCVGRNYEAHAKEMGQAVDREKPFYFTKSRDAIVLSGGTIPYPCGTENYHYEMELVVVIGAPAFRVSVQDAMSKVFGYACGLDMTRRDIQLAERAKQLPWDLGKDVENSAVISAIVPAAQFGAPAKQRIEMRQNGVTKQDGDLSLLIWSVPEIISHLSGFYHLRPGDLIYTGTPAGVGPVQPGDVLEGSIAGAGDLKITIGARE